MSEAFVLSEQQLSEILTGNTEVSNWYSAMLKFFPIYEINTPERVAAFLSQCGHESAGFKVLKENLNYRWESLRRVFPKYFPTDELAQSYAKQPEKIANRVYGNRMGNGDETSGDGFRYSGKGVIQLTGKNNYKAFAESAGLELSGVPAYLLTFDGAIHSACWFWKTNNLNRWVDAGDFDGLSDCINIGRKTTKEGDAIGYADRLKHYTHALEILKVGE
jgi:putative chitinase